MNLGSILIICVLSNITFSLLRVHVVPHTHIDPGWKNTFDGYYGRKVREIFKNVLKSINDNRDRTFLMCEMSYIQMFFDDEQVEQSLKDMMKQFVEEGNIQIVLGGWTMPDEAILTYSSVLEDITLGHETIVKIFGEKYLPKVQWRIDSFGHSSVATEIFHDMGMKQAVLHRIGNPEKKRREKTNEKDFSWELSYGKNVLTTIMDSYTVLSTGQSAENLNDFIRNRWTPSGITGNYLLPFGGDFCFVQDKPGETYDSEFEQWEIIMDTINSHPETYGMEFFYSTPDKYFEDVKKYFEKSETPDLPTYNGDFIPYNEKGGPDWWTGYYSSWPMIKEYENRLENMLRTANVFFTLSYHQTLKTDPLGYGGSDYFRGIYSNFMDLWSDFSLICHHDAITGTSQKRVMEDYLKRAKESLTKGSAVISKMMNQLILQNLYTKEFQVFGDEIVPDLEGLEHPQHDEELEFKSSSTEETSNYLAIVVTNSLAWERSEISEVPIPKKWKFEDSLCISDMNSVLVESQISADLNDKHFYLHFMADVPSLGYTTYFLHSCSTHTTDNPITKQHKNEEFTVQSIGEELTIGSDGRIQKYGDLDLEQTYRSYTSCSRHNGCDGQVSGAYVFRPLNEKEQPPKQIEWTREKITQTKEGNVISEIEQTMTEYLSHTMKLYPHFIEFVIRSGPIPDDMEIVTEICSKKLNSSDLLFSLNGFKKKNVHGEFTKDDDVGRKFYPLVTMGWIEDKNFRLTVLSSQGHAMSSLQNGCVQVMIHRSPSSDDGKGVQEGLSHAKDIVRGKIRVFLEEKQQKENENGKMMSPEEMERMSIEMKHPMVVLSSGDFMRHPTEEESDNQPPETRHQWEAQFLEGWPVDEGFHLESFQSIFADQRDPDFTKNSLGTIIRYRCLSSECQCSTDKEKQDKELISKMDALFPQFEVRNIKEVQLNGIEFPPEVSFLGKSDIITLRADLEYILPPTERNDDDDQKNENESTEASGSDQLVVREWLKTIFIVLFISMFVVIVGSGFIMLITFFVLRYLGSRRIRKENENARYMRLNTFDSGEDTEEIMGSDSSNI